MAEEQSPPHIILFTGHMLDAADRKKPRFPPASEELAREMISQAVGRIARKARATGKELIGISGGASGGDILFQEVCRAMGIKSKLYLALPKDKYLASSVAPAGEAWPGRFNDLYRQNEIEFLRNNGELPGRLHDNNKHSTWELANLWMLQETIAMSKNDFTLIALWNGEQGDGPGGTKDMVARAKAQGAGFIYLDAKRLLQK